MLVKFLTISRENAPEGCVTGAGIVREAKNTGDVEGYFAESAGKRRARTCSTSDSSTGLEM